MKTYRFKLYKSKKQKHLHRRVRVAGEIYNHLIALHKRYYRLHGKYINKFKIKKHLTKIKKIQKYNHWVIVGSQAIQDIVFRIDFGYQKFFKKENKRRPSFRKLKKFKSFTLTQAGWCLNDNGSVKIGEHTYKYFNSQEVNGSQKLMHVKRDTLGDFYIIIITDYEEPKPKYNTASGKSVGIDFGLKTFFIMSDGNNIESPQFFKQNKNAIAKANRIFSNKMKGSKSRKQARKSLARIHKRVASKRKDWQFKQAGILAANYCAIFLEDLNIKGMKALWGRKVSDLAFYNQVLILKHQCAKTGTILHQIDRWTPTTKACHMCGGINDNLTLNDREWNCTDCGEQHDRDLNAAINIHNVGASTFGLDTISRACSHVLLKA